MKLRTEISLKSSGCAIDFGQSIYLTGSCFSENIASKFKYFGFRTLANSHGIIYNPTSILESLKDVIGKRKYLADDLVQINSKYLSLSHHGSFDSERDSVTLDKINSSIYEHHAFLKEASFIFITLGTSWVYEWKKSDRIVANCHKIPSENFKKRILTSDEIHHSLSSMIRLLTEFNPYAEIVFTLSPVKHLKDGFVENQQSKSLLHTCIQDVLQNRVNYFPAYEIMNDDLRDYRFWSRDMMHPSELALDYIWDKVVEVYMRPLTVEIMKEVNGLQQFVGHRSLTENILDIEKLEAEKKNKLILLKNKYPHIHL